jgi:fluoroacetyl-CoA thioesterase
MTVAAHAILAAIDVRKRTFAITAQDGVDQITSGSHERFVINAAKFSDKLVRRQRVQPG